MPLHARNGTPFRSVPSRRTSFGYSPGAALPPGWRWRLLQGPNAGLSPSDRSVIGGPIGEIIGTWRCGFGSKKIEFDVKRAHGYFNVDPCFGESGLSQTEKNSTADKMRLSDDLGSGKGSRASANEYVFRNGRYESTIIRQKTWYEKLFFALTKYINNVYKLF